MWTPATRAQHTRVAKRYQTDLSDAEWRLISAFPPEESSTGRRRQWPMREIVNAVFYVLRGGITWRMLPKDFPPWSMVYRWFARLRAEAVFERMSHASVMTDRQRAGRNASPSAAIIDSQSVKTTESGGPRGYDAGKKVKGRIPFDFAGDASIAVVTESRPVRPAATPTGVTGGASGGGSGAVPLRSRSTIHDQNPTPQ